MTEEERVLEEALRDLGIITDMTYADITKDLIASLATRGAKIVMVYGDD